MKIQTLTAPTPWSTLPNRGDRASAISQNCNLQTPPKPGQSGELETLLALAKARGIDLATLDR